MRTSPAQGERDDAADPDRLARLHRALAVDADVACLDQRLGQRAALGEPDAVEEAVDAHSCALALQPGESGEGVAGAWRGGRTARAAAAAPAPRWRRRWRNRLPPSAAASRSASRPSDVARARSIGSSPPAARTLWAWAARRSARSTRSQCAPKRRKARRRRADRRRRRESRRRAAGARHRLAGADRDQGGPPALGLGLQQGRDEQVERAEADAQAMERVAVGLVEQGDRLGQRAPRQELRRRRPASRSARAPRASWRGRGRWWRGSSSGLRWRAIDGVEPGFEPRAQGGAARRGQAVEGARGPQRRLEQGAAGREAGEDMAVPATATPPLASTIRAKSLSGAASSALARRSSSSPRRRSAAASSRRLSTSRAVGSTRKSKPVKWPIGSGPTLTSPSAATVTGKRVGAARADVADQHRGAAVDEALGQPFVQGVAEPRFDLAGALDPFGGIGQPVAAVGDIGPAAHPGEAVGERLDVARDIVEPGDLGGKPFVGDMPALADIAEDAADHARVVHRPDLAEIGQAAGRPQPLGRRAAPGGDGRVLGDQLQHREVDRERRGAQQRVVAARFEAGDQGADIGEVELRAAPVEMVDRAGSGGPRWRGFPRR